MNSILKRASPFELKASYFYIILAIAINFVNFPHPYKTWVVVGHAPVTLLLPLLQLFFFLMDRFFRSTACYDKLHFTVRFPQCIWTSFTHILVYKETEWEALYQNVLILLLLGRPLEIILGWNKFLRVYALSIIIECLLTLFPYTRMDYGSFTFSAILIGSNILVFVIMATTLRVHISFKILEIFIILVGLLFSGAILALKPNDFPISKIISNGVSACWGGLGLSVYIITKVLKYHFPTDLTLYKLFLITYSWYITMAVFNYNIYVRPRNSKIFVSVCIVCVTMMVGILYSCAKLNELDEY